MSEIILIVPVILGALVGCTLGIFCFRYRRKPGATYLGLLLLSAGWWSLSYGLELLTADPDMNFLWFAAGIVGNAFLSPLAVLFAMDYSGMPLARRGWFIGALCLEPILHILVTHTNHLHSLMYSTIEFQHHGVLTLAIRQWGIWFAIDEVLGMTMVILAMAILLRQTLRSPRVFRRQLLGVATALLLSVLLRALTVVGIVPLEGYDLTHVSFVLAGSALALSFFRFGLFDILPAAREKIIEGLTDGIVVLDSNDHCVDANAAARKFLRGPRRKVVGEEASLALAPELLQALEQSRAENRAVEISLEDLATHLVSRAPVLSSSGEGAGEVVLIRDVTSEVEVRQAHIDATRSAEETSRAQSAFLANISHELRTPLNLVLGFTDALKHDPRSPLAKSQEEYVGEIEEAGRLLLDLVNLVLSLSRIDAGKRQVDLVEFDLVDFCRELSTHFHSDPTKSSGLRLPNREVLVSSDMEITSEIIIAIAKIVTEVDEREEGVVVHVIAGGDNKAQGENVASPRIAITAPLFSRRASHFRKLLSAEASGAESPPDIDLRTWLQIRLASRLSALIDARLEFSSSGTASEGFALVFDDNPVG